MPKELREYMEIEALCRIYKCLIRNKLWKIIQEFKIVAPPPWYKYFGYVPVYYTVVMFKMLMFVYVINIGKMTTINIKHIMTCVTIFVLRRTTDKLKWSVRSKIQVITYFEVGSEKKTN